jgi:hypothetical protein
MARPQRFCVFCNKPRLTKQHLWADRLKDILPGTSYNTLSIRDDTTLSDRSIRRGISRYTSQPGAAKSRKLKNFCIECNPGWMRLLEEAAIPIAKPLMLGSSITLSSNEQDILARWVALNAVVSEYLDPKSAAVSLETRKQLMAGHLTQEWIVSLASYEGGGSWETRVTRHSMTLIREFQPPTAPGISPSPLGPLNVKRPVIKNTQMTTIGARHLIMQAVSCPLSEIRLRYQEALRGLGAIQIFPTLGNATVGAPQLTEAATTLFADWLDSWLHHPQTSGSERRFTYSTPHLPGRKSNH